MKKKISFIINHLSFSVCAVCVALLLIGCSEKQVGKTGGFVERKNASFVLDGKEYRYVGTNFWYGAILASEGQGGDRARLLRELDKLHEMGLDNLRILVGSDGKRGVMTKVEPTLQESPGVYNDTILAGLDYLLQQMGERGMKAVLYLNNAWEWSGGYGFYLEQAGAGKAPRPNETSYPEYMSFVSQFSTNTKAQELFFQYVRDIIGRTNRYTNVPYCDDPAIMSWQIGNEPRAFNDEVKEPFAKWLRQTSALIRSLDKNHLISIGSEGIWGCEMDADLYEKICADPNIDYMNAHVWPYNWSWAIYTATPPSPSVFKSLSSLRNSAIRAMALHSCQALLPWGATATMILCSRLSRASRRCVAATSGDGVGRHAPLTNSGRWVTTTAATRHRNSRG